MIDDVQLIYHLTEFWGCFKDPVQYSCNLLAFATYGASTGLGSYTTPVGMGVYLTYEFTKFKREEVLELVENVRNHKHANCLTPNIIDEIQIMTGFHAGLTVYCIQVVLNGEYTHFKIYKYIINIIFGTQIFPSVFFLNQIPNTTNKWWIISFQQANSSTWLKKRCHVCAKFDDSQRNNPFI